jgi:hypothetical protein
VVEVFSFASIVNFVERIVEPASFISTVGIPEDESALSDLRGSWRRVDGVCAEVRESGEDVIARND